MRAIELTPNLADGLKVNKEQHDKLVTYLHEEVLDAISARQAQEQLWREVLRLYEGVPKKEMRDTPIVNMPNIELTVGASAVEKVYAQVLDLIYTIMPTLTARALDERYTEEAKAIQRFVNWLAEEEAGMRAAVEEAYMDNIQLGTGILYCPWVEYMRKTKVQEVLAAGSTMRSVPPEDFLTPGGADSDLQEAQWVGMRLYMTLGELQMRSKLRGWNIEGVQPIGSVSWIRSRREALARTMTSRRIRDLYETWDIYVFYDIDGDGIEEDLLVRWDNTSRKIMKIQYNPYDRRPFEVMRYQIRPHLFYGIGVMEMMKPYQEAATEQFAHWLLNMILANSRLWKGREGIVSATMQVWPSKVILLPDPTNDLVSEQLADTYQSAPQALATTIGFAADRVGINDVASPQRGTIGNRTPGITALSVLQQVNRRFTPAFDGMRLATASAMRQCVWRYQERLLAGDAKVEAKLVKIFGPADGRMIVNQLKNKDFDDAFSIELTASSASVNRDADKQNALMLINVLAQYYQKTIELTMMAANPQVPQAIRDVANKVSHAMGEAVDRTLRTFDQVRDPRLFIIDLTAELEQLRGIDQSSLAAALNQQMGVQQPVQPGAAPPGEANGPSSPPPE